MKLIHLHLSKIIFALIGAATLASNTSIAAEQGSYYEGEKLQIFRPYPKDFGREGSRSWRIRYFGPVGIGIDLKRPGMTMEIANVEKGSPADKTGKLKPGQIIESINGTVLKDYDPRMILGNIITKAEATDGVIHLKIKGQGDVRVQIPVMGVYSGTWPVKCPKSDKIVRNLADLIAQEKTPSWGSVLFMLSTGEEKDLKVVRRWMRGIESIGGMNWEKGYKGIGLCEYYLRTGDQSVLPVIKKMTEELKVHMYNGGWSGRGASAAFTYSTGSGQVHASGMHCLTFILMARLCGVEVDNYMLNESLTQFYRFGGHGNVAYGNGAPEGGFRDNGKTSGLAVAMAVAAQLTPEGENSVYAMARDNSAMKAFYATNWFHAAHTGGGMGEIWHHGAMALMREKRPIPYRSYHDTRRWVMELSRRHDGSIGIAGMDDQYNRSLTDAAAGRAWGTYFALTYTYPRKALQIWGAPRSKWAKHFQLPERPWGNAADDVFNSPDPVPYQNGLLLTKDDLLNETVHKDASLAVMYAHQDLGVTAADISKRLFHPEYAYRAGAMANIVGRGWVHLVVPLLKSDDPRLRHAGLLAFTGMFKGPSLKKDQITPEMFDLVGSMIEDPNESWWVTLYAIKALNRADADVVEQHRDRLIELLKYDSDWIQEAAIRTLTKIANDRKHYKEVYPAIIHTTANLTVDSSSYNAIMSIRGAIEAANSDVKAFAGPLLKRVYADFPHDLKDPYTGAVMKDGAMTVRKRIGSVIQKLPDGEGFVRRIPKTTLKSFISGSDSDMYVYDGKFIPNDKLLGTWHWAVHPIPKKPKDIDPTIKGWIKSRGDGPIKMDKAKDVLVIENEGKTSKSNYFKKYFWSGDKLIGNEDSVALNMEVRTYKGIDFLVVEKGKFGDRLNEGQLDDVPRDYHCGFFVYIRAK